ncbi:hypothetical protein H4219_002456 [Mycoemilia scoparia]|uniref:Uncharacterized protein n=1 Tax=Mycoemilia scoparia TaxID=417184 RepID=A0A9W7ZY88_9FUNG|nr:hypothetical protein H4219_002456 [Mycoemilia scoparia]
MSEYSVSRGSKLKFKGEKKKKKKGSKSKHSDRSKSNNDNDNAEGWVPVECLDDFEGPVVFYFRDSNPRILSLPPDFADGGSNAGGGGIGSINNRQSLLAYPLSHESAETQVEDAEPTAVEHVFIGQRTIVAREKEDPNIPLPTTFTFKTSRGQYLSADRLGFVTSDAPAIGPLEVWTPVIRKDEAGVGAVSLMTEASGKERFLSIGISKDQDPEQTGKKDSHIPVGVRADSDSIGFRETFYVKCQAQNRKARIKSSKDKSGNEQDVFVYGDGSAISQGPDDDELNKIKYFQSYQSGKISSHKLKKDKKDLKRARSEGKYNEALLDRRTKLKSDKFC